MLKVVALVAVMLAALTAATPKDPDDSGKIHEVVMSQKHVPQGDLRGMGGAVVGFQKLSKYWNNRILLLLLNGKGKTRIPTGKYSHVGRKRETQDEQADSREPRKNIAKWKYNHVGRKRQFQDEQVENDRDDKEAMWKYNHVGRKRQFQDEQAAGRREFKWDAPKKWKYNHVGRKRQFQDEQGGKHSHVGRKRQFQDERVENDRDDKEAKGRYGHIGKK